MAGPEIFACAVFVPEAIIVPADGGVAGVAGVGAVVLPAAVGVGHGIAFPLAEAWLLNL